MNIRNEKLAEKIEIWDIKKMEDLYRGVMEKWFKIIE